MKRGVEIDHALGGNLPKYFPVIDRFVNGVAESIKSIDLTATSYQDLNKLRWTLTDYVNKLANFKRANFAGEVIREGDIKQKILTVAIEPGKCNAAQSKVFSEVAKYAKEKGIKLVTKEVE